MSEQKFLAWTDDMYDSLTRHCVKIVFVKKDQSERQMICTLNLDKIPKESHPSGKIVYDHTNMIRVFDLENKDWRTVNKRTISSYEPDFQFKVEC